MTDLSQAIARTLCEKAAFSDGSQLRRRDLNLSVEFYDISFRVAEEKRAMPPVRNIPWRAQDRHTLRLQRLMTSIEHVWRDPECELNSSGTGSDRTVIPPKPGPRGLNVSSAEPT